MPLLLLLPIAGVALGSFLSSNTLANGIFSSTPSAPSAAADGSLVPPSIYTIAVYGGVGLGLYWLYRKAAKA